MIIFWIFVAGACLMMFWRCRFLLSPTAIFFAYFALVFPLSYLVSYALDLPSPLFLAPRAIPHDKIAFAFAQVLLALACFCMGGSYCRVFSCDGGVYKSSPADFSLWSLQRYSWPSREARLLFGRSADWRCL